MEGKNAATGQHIYWRGGIYWGIRGGKAGEVDDVVVHRAGPVL